MRNVIVTVLAAFGFLALAAHPAASQTSYWAVRNNAAALFKVGEYEALDRMAASYLENETRSPSGLWLLTALYNGLGKEISADGAEDGFFEAERKLVEWIERYPDSTVARIGYGRALVEHAWFFRSVGFASSVDDEDWAPFREYIEKARVYLAEIEDIGEIDPQWYTEMLVVGKAQHWPLEDFMEMVYQGLNTHPYYYEIHFGAVEYLLPKWHGSAAAVEEFASISAEYTRDIDGEAMYARVQMQLSRNQFGKDLFTKGHADWTRMSMGIDDILALYPDQRNINKFARFACMAGDQEKTRQLLARIEGEHIGRIWKSYGPDFHECHEWAYG